MDRGDRGKVDIGREYKCLVREDTCREGIVL
jgi:hypothetical protein